MAKINDYLMPGGPEGNQNYDSNDLSRGAYQTVFRTGPLAGKYDAVVAAAAKQDIPASLMAAIMMIETKPRGGPFGTNNAVLNFLNPAGLMVRGSKVFMKFPTIE